MSVLLRILAAATLAAILHLPLEAQAQSDRWLPYEGHLTVYFSIDHAGMSLTRGMFREITGELTFDEKNPEASEVSVKIEAGSLDTGHAFRDTFVKGPQFLDVTKYRFITFKSTKVTKTGEKTGTIVGDLTMHGVTKPVTLNARFNKAAKRPSGEDYIGFSATASLNRTDWEVNGFSSKSPPAITGETVDMEITAEFVRQK